jgi:nucleolar protein 4
VEAADNAISAANAASGMGILVKGRPLKVLKALDKKSAHEKELEKEKNEVKKYEGLLKEAEVKGLADIERS